MALAGGRAAQLAAKVKREANAEALRLALAAKAAAAAERGMPQMLLRAVAELEVRLVQQNRMATVATVLLTCAMVTPGYAMIRLRGAGALGWRPAAGPDGYDPV